MNIENDIKSQNIKISIEIESEVYGILLSLASKKNISFNALVERYFCKLTK